MVSKRLLRRVHTFGNLRCFSRVVLFLFFTGLSIFALAATNEVVPLVLSVDLRGVGYYQPATERDRRASDFLYDAVVFLDDQTLAVSFLALNDHPGPSTRENPTGSPVLFHTVFLNPRNGHVDWQTSWGNAGNWMALLPLIDGNFFVQDYDRLAIYSRDFKQVVSRTIKVPGDLFPRFAVSPSGQTLFAFEDTYDPHQGWRTSIDMLDSLTLGSNHSVITTGHKFETVSDSKVVYSLAMHTGPLRLLIHDANQSKPPKSLDLFDPHLNTAKQIAKSHCSTAQFISDSVLVVSGKCTSLFLIRSGEIVQDIATSDFQFGSDFRAARNGIRFAFARSKTKANSKTISNLEICIYDISRHKIIFTAPIAPLPQQKLSFALSPDGSLLALQTDGLLRVWTIPVSGD